MELFNMKPQNNFLLIITLASVFCTNLEAKTLSVKDYITQVSSSNGNYKAAELYVKAYGLRAAEASLEFLPSLIGNFSYTDSRLVPTNSFSPTQTIAWGGYLGVQTKLRTGTQVSLTYNSTQNNQSGGFALPYSYYYNYPSLTLTQPLWKDFLAAASSANEEAQIATFKALQMTHQFSKQQIHYNAETAYWRLALYREIIKYDKQSLERTEKILAWNKKRVAMNVADRVDLLQAQAALKQRELQFQNDTEMLRQISSDFNKLRGQSGDVVNEEVHLIDNGLVFVNSKEFSELKKTADRLDVIAQIQNNEATKAQARAAIERVKPDISLYGTAQFSGINNAFDQAQSNSFTNTNPYYQVGLKINVPLDFGLVSEVYEGNKAAQTAAQYSIQKTKADLEQDWIDLQKKFKDVLTRFEMAKELEELQRVKLEHEKRRFNAGRTTSFQVLQFEDNYSDAQLNRLRIENDAITLRALARLYNGENL